MAIADRPGKMDDEGRGVGAHKGNFIIMEISKPSIKLKSDSLLCAEQKHNITSVAQATHPAQRHIRNSANTAIH